MLPAVKNSKIIIFDLDGTIWNWTELIDGAKTVVEKLREKDKRVYFVSNNPILSREGVAKKLTQMGIKTSPESVLLSSTSAAKYFKKNEINKVYLIGEQGVVEELSKQGIKIDDDAKHILISVDRNFNIWKLKNAYDLVERGAKVYTTGICKYWEINSHKNRLPAELPIIRALQAMVDVKVRNLGEPSEAMRNYVMNEIKPFPEDVVMVGDSVNMDIVFANRCGFRSVLFVKDKKNLEELNKLKGDEKPSAVITSLYDLITGY